ncbi:MAG: hypothetical protein J7497_01690 [Chitinophagaceae bacterium]|nr:hypothetical protein [Chitinophagaceae bacterium]
MNRAGNNKKTMTLGKLLSVSLMIVCLTLLTSMNFFLYSSTAKQAGIVTATTGSDAEDSSNNYPPSGPTEEKSGNQAFSFSEEILHEAHPEFNFSAINLLYLHHIAAAEKIEMFHPELLLPPPKI